MRLLIWIAFLMLAALASARGQGKLSIERVFGPETPTGPYKHPAAITELGFKAVQFMGAPVVLDGGIGGFAPANTGFFLNTKYLFLRPHKDRDMVPLNPDRRSSTNQDAAVSILAWAGNMTSNGAQFQGQLKGF